MALTYQGVDLSNPAFGGGGNPPYSASFDATSSWGTASGGEYTITITEATHGLGTNVQVQAFELTGGNYQHVELDIVISPSGDVNIKVTEVPDLRFQGKVVIIGE
jgi:hypothetical protein